MNERKARSWDAFLKVELLTLHSVSKTESLCANSETNHIVKDVRLAAIYINKKQWSGTQKCILCEPALSLQANSS